jgi:hypothetical protein
MSRTRKKTKTTKAALIAIALVAVTTSAWSAGPGTYDKVIHPITQPMHADMTVAQENWFEIYTAIVGACHADDPHCSDRQAWDDEAAAPMLGGGRILFKATNASGQPASFVTSAAQMDLYFGYDSPPAADHRIPRSVCLHGERAQGEMTTFEDGPTLMFLNEGESIVELPTLEVRGLRLLRPTGVGFGVQTSNEGSRIDVMLHENVVEDVVHGTAPTFYDAVAYYLENSGVLVVSNNEVRRTNPDPALAEIGIWAVGNNGPQYANITGNRVEVTHATASYLQTCSLVIGAFSWDLGYTEENIYNVSNNFLGEGVTVWTPNGAVSITGNDIVTDRDAIWLSTQEETSLLVAHNDIEMLPPGRQVFRLGVSVYGLPFYGGLITANEVRGVGEYGGYVTFGSEDGVFVANAMRKLETTHELFYFDETTHDNTVIGYTDGCNVLDLGTDNCIVGCGCFAP